MKKDIRIFMVWQLPMFTGRAREMYSTIRKKKNVQNSHLMFPPDKKITSLMTNSIFLLFQENYKKYRNELFVKL